MLDKIYSWFCAPVVTSTGAQQTLSTRDRALLFGAKIRVARSKHGLTQRDLAALIPGTKAQEVHDWEYAKAWPRPSQRAALHDLFGGDIA